MLTSKAAYHLEDSSAYKVAYSRISPKVGLEDYKCMSVL